MARKHPRCRLSLFDLDRFVGEITTYSFRYMDLVEQFFPHVVPLLARAQRPEAIPLSLIEHIVDRLAAWTPQTGANVLLESFTAHRDELLQSPYLHRQQALRDSLANAERLFTSEWERPSRAFPITVQVPFQQAATITLFQKIVEEETFPGASSEPPITFDFSSTSSVDIFQRILGGYTDAPDLICLNVFNALEFVMKDPIRPELTYVPLCSLPDATQALTSIGWGDALEGAERHLYYFGEPYSSLRMNYVKLLATERLPPTTPSTNLFPSVLVRALARGDSKDFGGKAALVWYPLIALLVDLGYLRPENVDAFRYHYACLLLARADSLSHPLVMTLPSRLRTVAERLLRQDLEIDRLLSRVAYVPALRKRFGLARR